MNTEILHTNVQAFISDNLNADITKIVLKGSPFKNITTKELVEQIEAKKRCEKKLPSWFKAQGIYYSNKLNIEQTSSELTAEYKSQLISGKSIIDITGGFGVDCYYFRQSFENVTHCEQNEELSEIARHNFKLLDVGIKTVANNGISYLQQNEIIYDWIYIDPSRRHDVKGKVFFLSDCLPNVPKHLADLLKCTSNILVKSSPLLDLSAGINELKYVTEIHIVAVNNEVKELLWILNQSKTEAIEITAVNIQKNSKDLVSFLWNEEKNTSLENTLPKTYLYEPNAAILKAGAFKSIGKRFDLKKLHEHSHLYTSDVLIDFPGRRFRINKVLPYNRKAFKKEGITKANISTRNFPEQVSELRKQLKIKDGGDIYLFFTTNSKNEKIILNCSKI